MNYKEIKKHNRAERKKYDDTWLSDNPYEPKYINLLEYVFDHAITDKGMTAYDRLRFHLYNPNGVVNQLPSYDDFQYINDSSMINMSYIRFSKFDNYHAKELQRLAKLSRAKTRDVNYHIARIYNDIEEAKKTMIELKLTGSLTYAKREVA